MTVTRVSVNPERRIPSEKRNMKSLAMSPPIKDPIPNQDSTRIIHQQYPTLPPLLSQWPTVHKPFFNDRYVSNKIEEEINDSTDNWCAENKDSVNILNGKKD